MNKYLQEEWNAWLREVAKKNEEEKQKLMSDLGRSNARRL